MKKKAEELLKRINPQELIGFTNAVTNNGLKTIYNLEKLTNKKETIEDIQVITYIQNKINLKLGNVYHLAVETCLKIINNEPLNKVEMYKYNLNSHDEKELDIIKNQLINKDKNVKIPIELQEWVIEKLTQGIITKVVLKTRYNKHILQLFFYYKYKNDSLSLDVAKHVIGNESIMPYIMKTDINPKGAIYDPMYLKKLMLLQPKKLKVNIKKAVSLKFNKYETETISAIYDIQKEHNIEYDKIQSIENKIYHDFIIQEKEIKEKTFNVFINKINYQRMIKFVNPIIDSLEIQDSRNGNSIHGYLDLKEITNLISILAITFPEKPMEEIMRDCRTLPYLHKIKTRFLSNYKKAGRTIEIFNEQDLNNIQLCGPNKNLIPYYELIANAYQLGSSKFVSAYGRKMNKTKWYKKAIENAL